MFSKAVVTLLLLILSPLTAHAIEFDCHLGSDKRTILLEYPGQDHLCEVSVTKTNNERTVQWYADKNSGFCRDKIYELVNKYTDEWNFKCTTKGDQLGIEDLSPRQQKILDATVRNVIQEGNVADIPFIVAGIRAHTADLASSNNTAIVVQLFIQASEAEIRTDRTYFFEDNGDQYSTTAVFAGLKTNIQLLDKRYQVESAIISAVYPAGTIEVDTTLTATDAASTYKSRCYGSQLFKPNAKGTLDPVNQHRYECNL